MPDAVSAECFDKCHGSQARELTDTRACRSTKQGATFDTILVEHRRRGCNVH
jgi:hypothetical protein